MSYYPSRNSRRSHSPLTLRRRHNLYLGVVDDQPIEPNPIRLVSISGSFESKFGEFFMTQTRLSEEILNVITTTFQIIFDQIGHSISKRAITHILQTSPTDYFSFPQNLTWESLVDEPKFASAMVSLDTIMEICDQVENFQFKSQKHLFDSMLGQSENEVYLSIHNAIDKSSKWIDLTERTNLMVEDCMLSLTSTDNTYMVIHDESQTYMVINKFQVPTYGKVTEHIYIHRVPSRMLADSVLKRRYGDIAVQMHSFVLKTFHPDYMVSTPLSIMELTFEKFVQRGLITNITETSLNDFLDKMDTQYKVTCAVPTVLYEVHNDKIF